MLEWGAAERRQPSNASQPPRVGVLKHTHLGERIAFGDAKTDKWAAAGAVNEWAFERRQPAAGRAQVTQVWVALVRIPVFSA